MRPELKFHSLVVSATTALMFLGWVNLNSLISAHPKLALVFSGLIALGTYRALVLLLLALFRNVKFVKKYILGPYFMAGSWAGFFVGHGVEVRLIVETFEQGLGTLVIRGRAFKEDGTYHGSWIADNASIDIRRAKLSYHYEADVVGNTFVNPGLASFDLERPQSHKPPFRLVGYSSDLFSPAKLVAFEEKATDCTTMETKDALETARRVYAKYKDHVCT